MAVKHVFLLTLAAASLALAPRKDRSSADCDASDLTDLVGYTAIASASVPGEFEGADFDKTVKLDNGMIFEFLEYNYTYSYYPDVVVFAKSATYRGRELLLYKLLIEDQLYDAMRLR